MKNFIFKYYNKVSKLPFFVHNDFKANLILILGILAFFIIAEDLGSELAAQKDEVGYVVATLTESIDSNNFNSASCYFFEPPIIGFLLIQDINCSSNYSFDFPTGRSPPVS